MISCTEFIPLYSELFKYLEELGGHEEVVRYWEYISDTYVAELLGGAVSEKGLRGCWEYWAKSLSEEACDFRMELDEPEGTFSIDMRRCPSRGMLNALSHMEPYYDYCGHCAVLYSRQLKKYGITSDSFDMSQVDKARCFERYRGTPKPGGERLVMDVKASENEYFHRDFHISGKRGLEYVGEKYGGDAVREYLTRFARAYYAPLAVKVKKEGLSALREHIERVYKAEKALECVRCTQSEGSLSVKVFACPGVKYIRETGNDPTKWYIEGTDTINRVLADMCGLRFELYAYEEKTGAAEYAFIIP